MPPVKFVLLTITVLLGGLAPAVAEVPDGQFMFNKRCANCHQAEALMPRLMKLPDEAARQAYLDKFLARHHARDAEERALIVDYLLKHQPR